MIKIAENFIIKIFGLILFVLGLSGFHEFIPLINKKGSPKTGAIVFKI